MGTTVPPAIQADKEGSAEGLGVSGDKPREIPWAGLFNDPGMPAAECVDEALTDRWADDIDRDR